MKSKTFQKVLFYLGILAILLGALGFFAPSMRLLFKPSDYILIAIVLLVLSLDAKNGSTFLG
ncbi:MAG: hypothetical protein ACYDBX_02840 [Patescibacteria group bacterium]